MREDQPQWVRRLIAAGRWYFAAVVLGYFIGRGLLLRHAPAPWPQVLGLVVASCAAAGVARVRRGRVERVLSQPPGLRCRCGYNLKFNKGRCPECGRPCIASTGRFADITPAVPDEAAD